MASNETNILYGLNSVIEAIHQSGFYNDDELYLARSSAPSSNSRLQHLLSKAKKKKVKIAKKSFAELTNLCLNDSHQGIVLVRKTAFTLKELQFPDFFSSGRLRYYVVADHIEDPQNLGAICRSIAAFDASGLIVPKRNNAPLGAAALKASAGYLAQTPVMVTAGIPSFMKQIEKYAYKENGRRYLFWAATADGISLQHVVAEISAADDLSVFIIVGSEGKGVSELVRERADVEVSIDINANVESLNVSVATALILQALYGLY